MMPTDAEIEAAVARLEAVVADSAAKARAHGEARARWVETLGRNWAAQVRARDWRAAREQDADIGAAYSAAYVIAAEMSAADEKRTEAGIGVVELVAAALKAEKEGPP